MRNEDATPVSNSVASGQAPGYDRPINPALKRRKPTDDELRAEDIMIKLQKQNAGKQPVVQ